MTCLVFPEQPVLCIPVTPTNTTVLTIMQCSIHRAAIVNPCIDLCMPTEDHHRGVFL